MTSDPRVAAIVLSYNGLEVLLQALTSLSRMTYSNVDLVVVDNGSSDGTEAAVREHHPGVTVLRTERNLGPAGGCNLGLKWALQRGYDYFLVLNNDIEVDSGMLTELVAVAQGHPEAGALGPKEYFYWDRQRIWSAGGCLRFREAVTSERGSGDIDRGQYDEICEVDYINGCAMLISEAALRRTGPWDPLFYLGVEDADFCTRMKKLGYRCLYVPQARLWHMVAYETGVYSPGKTFHTGRSSALYVRRYASLTQRAAALAFMLVSLPVAFLRELRRGNQAAVLAKARGFWTGFRVQLTDPPEWDATIVDKGRG